MELTLFIARGEHWRAKVICCQKRAWFGQIVGETDELRVVLKKRGPLLRRCFRTHI